MDETHSTVSSAEYVDESDDLKRKRLLNLFIRQTERKSFILKFRAFKKWQDRYPLVMKCIELARQLQERSSMLETVRSSYLKDVVSVKHQLAGLSKLTEESITQQVPKQSLEE
eukprot:gene19054-13751_t